jgi:hypothetical protein
MEKALELQKKWGTTSGQCWKIGKHSLTIGDNRKIKVSREALDGACTDPPFDLPAAEVLSAIGRRTSRAVVLSGDGLAFGLAKMWVARWAMIWKHPWHRKAPNFNMPRLVHAYAVVLTQTRKIRSGFRRPRPDFDSVIELEDDEFSPSLSRYMKPTLLFYNMLCGFDWQTVYDPYAGTLPVLIAAEQLNKSFYGVEIDPRMAAIGLERCADFGLKISLDKPTAAIG